MNKILLIILVVVLSGCSTKKNISYSLTELMEPTSLTKNEEILPIVYICPIVKSRTQKSNKSSQQEIFKSQTGGNFFNNITYYGDYDSFMMFAASEDNIYYKSTSYEFYPHKKEADKDDRKRYANDYKSSINFIPGNIQLSQSYKEKNMYISVFDGLRLSDLKLTRIIDIFDPTTQSKVKETIEFQCFTKDLTDDLSRKKLECGKVPNHSEYKKYIPDFSKKRLLIDFDEPNMIYFSIKDRVYIFEKEYVKYSKPYKFMDLKVARRMNTEQPIVDDDLACRYIK